MTRREMIDAILILQRDLRETMRELGDVRSRVWQLERERDIKRPNGGRRPGRFQSLTAHAGDMKPWREHE